MNATIYDQLFLFSLKTSFDWSKLICEIEKLIYEIYIDTYLFCEFRGKSAVCRAVVAIPSLYSLYMICDRVMIMWLVAWGARRQSQSYQGRSTSPQYIEGMTHTGKDSCVFDSSAIIK